jgi:hypothetical protein
MSAMGSRRHCKVIGACPLYPPPKPDILAFSTHVSKGPWRASGDPGSALSAIEWLQRSRRNRSGDHSPMISINGRLVWSNAAGETAAFKTRAA